MNNFLCASRPLSRILVAKRVAAPLMIIALTEVPINVVVNYLLIVHFDLQVSHTS
jgi:Na+-driven multidrug efflux pump